MSKNPPLAVTSNGNKINLRERYLTLRESISVNELEKSSKDICDQLLNHFNFSNQNIHLFYPIEGKNEINTWPIHHKLIKSNQLHTSVYNSLSNQWDCVCFDANSTFVKKRYNIPVPDTFKHAKWDKIDIILMPLLCFDDYGNRIDMVKEFMIKYVNVLISHVSKLGFLF